MARRAGRAVALAALLVLSVVAGSVALAGSAAAAPDGFVSVTDDQVSSDLPARTPMGEAAEEISNAGVMASDHADSLEVLVTNPGRAKSYSDSGTVFGSGPVAIVLTDDAVSDGRTVALPAKEIEDVLEYKPELARGTHEDGSAWNSTIEYEDGWMLVDVPHFSDNVVTFSGSVQIGDTFTDGSTVQYDLPELDSASDPTINLTGILNREWRNSTGTDVPLFHTSVLNLGGTEQPTDGMGNNPLLEVTANEIIKIHNPMDDLGTGSSDGTDSQVIVAGDTGFDAGHKSEVQLQPQNSGVATEATLQIGDIDTDAANNNLDIDVYLSEGGLDETVGQGTLVKSGWDIDSTGANTITFDEGFAVTANQNYTLEFETGWTDNDGTRDGVFIEYESTGGENWMWSDRYAFQDAYANADLTIEQNVNAVNVSADGLSHSFGDFANGETKSTRLDLSTAASELNFTGEGYGTIDYTLTVQAKTETQDPGVILNGNETVEHTGTLPDGESTSLTLSKSTLKEGTNNVTVDMPELSADAPPMQVDLEYSHDAQDDQNVTFESEKFSERYNVSKTYGSDRANPELTIPFADESISIRDAEYRLNGGAWQTTDQWVVSNTTGTIELPDMNAGDTVEVRVNASKVSVQNGAIQVLEATPAVDALDSKIEITEHRSDFAIDVSGVDDERLVYAYNPSWSSPDDHAYLEANGDQELRLPEAGVGSTTRVRDLPMYATPENDVEIAVEDPDQPTFQLRPGATEGDMVEIEYRDTISGQAYELRDITNDRPADTDTAESPVFFSTNDDLRTFKILETELVSNGPVVGTGAEEDSGAIPEWLMLFGAVIGGIVVLMLISRYFDIGSASGYRPSWLTAIGGSILGIVAVELVTAGSIVADVVLGSLNIATDAGQGLFGASLEFLSSGIGSIFIAVALLIALLYIDQRTEIELSMPVYVGAGGLILLFVLESLSGGIVDALAAGLEEVGPLIWLGLIGGGAALIYLWIRAERRPDTKVTLDLGRGGT